MTDFPTLSSISEIDIATLRASGEFDEEWYLREYPDVQESGIDAARHFLWLGQRLGRAGVGPARDPQETGASYFSRTAIGGTAASASRAKQASQQTAANDAAHAAETIAGTSNSTETGVEVGLIDRTRKFLTRKRQSRGDAVYDLIFEHFDDDFYLSTYPDVAAANVDPVLHYKNEGWKEGRNPTLSFSTQYYLDNNPDVAEAGVNPFYHFLAAGKAEGRAGKHELGFRWDILAALKTVPEQIAEIKAHRPPATLAPALEDLEAAFKREMAGSKSWVLSLSHDNFAENVGGVQLLLRRELGLFRDQGVMHCHVFPQFPLPFLETQDPVSLGVLLNGKLIGFFRAQDVANAFEKLDLSSQSGSFIVHSLLGHNMDETLRILAAAKIDRGLLWLHDYAPIYNNFKLLRNDVEYCGYPRAGTIARELCAFAQADFSHAEEFAKLFDAVDVQLVSPSQAALDIWQDADVLEASSNHVINHVALKPRPVQFKAKKKHGDPLRIGFLGYPAMHKGWSVFQELVLRHADDARYEFYHFGKGRVGGLPVKFVEVSASENNLNAMSKALTSMEIDVALVWSIWPETFCLTAYEALAAGCSIVTNPDAGNIVAAVNETRQGIVLEDEKALQKAFESGDLDEFCRSRRNVTEYEMVYSNLSLEVIG